MTYTWSFKKDVEIWGSGEYNTIAECLKEAREEAKRDKQQTVVYIGECIPWEPRVNEYTVLDQLEEDACYECGEVGCDWQPYSWKKREERKELADILTNAVCDWMKKYGYYPDFYKIEDIKEYRI